MEMVLFTNTAKSLGATGGLGISGYSAEWRRKNTVNYEREIYK